MTTVLSARLPRVLTRVLALAGVALAAVTADVSAAAAQPGPTAMFNDPAITNYRLTSANLTKFINATNALKQLDGEDFDLEEQFEMEDPEDFDLNQIAAAFDSEPRIKNAINGAGFSSREYLTFMFAAMQAMFASVMVQMGGEQALNDMPAGVLKDNIQFIMQNQEALEALDDDGD